MPWSNILFYFNIIIILFMVAFVSTLGVFPNVAHEWLKCIERILEGINGLILVKKSVLP